MFNASFCNICQFCSNIDLNSVICNSHENWRLLITIVLLQIALSLSLCDIIFPFEHSVQCEKQNRKPFIRIFLCKEKNRSVQVGYGSLCGQTYAIFEWYSLIFLVLIKYEECVVSVSMRERKKNACPCKMKTVENVGLANPATADNTHLLFYYLNWWFEQLGCC